MEGRRELIEKIRELTRDEKVRRLVEGRMKEFKERRSGGEEETFKELCFCILTAGFNAERSMLIQEEIGDGFIKLSEQELARRLRELGHRFPESRARYIVEARKYIEVLKFLISSGEDGARIREWLVRNVRGIGYKEASHFLRNVGFNDVAILDFHVLNVLARHNIVGRVKRLSRREYLKIEGILRELANELGLTLGELDLYLWYLETGRILK